MVCLFCSFFVGIVLIIDDSILVPFFRGPLVLPEHRASPDYRDCRVCPDPRERKASRETEEWM